MAISGGGVSWVANRGGDVARDFHNKCSRGTRRIGVNSGVSRPWRAQKIQEERAEVGSIGGGGGEKARTGRRRMSLRRRDVFN